MSKATIIIGDQEFTIEGAWEIYKELKNIFERNDFNPSPITSPYWPDGGLQELIKYPWETPVVYRGMGENSCNVKSSS